MRMNGVQKSVKRGMALFLAVVMMLTSVNVLGIRVKAAEDPSAKIKPEVVTNPTLTGVYGDTPQTLQVTGGEVTYDGKTVTGTWKVTDTDNTVLEVGTQKECEVTFTPGEEDIYEDVVVYVVPTINKAKGEIIKGKDFSEYRQPYYGDTPFSLFVTGNHSESKLIYTVSNSKKLDHSVVENDQIILVDSEGNVTIKNPGFASITVSMPESKNYTEAEPVTVFVSIAKGNLPLSNIVKEYPYTKERSDTIDIASMLPKDCKEVTMKILQVATLDGKYFLREAPVLGAGKLSYTTNKGEVGSIIQINVRIEADRYDGNLLIDLRLVEPEGVNLIGDVTLASNVLTYGESLSELNFNNVVFVGEKSGEIVSGTMTWKEPDYKPPVGEHYVEWKFTPNDEGYASVENRISIFVQKAVPKVTTLPTVTDRVYDPSKALLDSELTGGTILDVDGKTLAGTWNWQDAGVIPSVDNTGYTAVFTPDDTDNYEKITKSIAVKVTKATPVIKEKPSAAEITYGDNLGKSTLTGGTVTYSDSDAREVAGTFTWKDSSVKPVVADSDNKEFAVVFTPTDTINYEAVETQITVNVKKAPVAPNIPGSTLGVANSVEKVKDVTLPTGWKWQEEDLDKELTVGVPVSATAEYSSADKENYEKTSVEISITRAASGGGSSAGGGASSGTTDPKQDEEKPTDDNKPSDDNNKPSESKPEAVGTKLTKSGITYKVTSVKGKTPTVTYMKVSKKAKGTVTIPKTVTIDGVKYQVTAIADKAFAGNKNVTKIVIPDTIKTIGKKAFSDCSNLKVIVIKSTKLTSKNIDAKAFAGIAKDVVIQVPEKKLEAYKKLFVKKKLNKKVKLKAIKSK